MKKLTYFKDRAELDQLAAKYGFEVDEFEESFILQHDKFPTRHVGSEAEIYGYISGLGSSIEIGRLHVHEIIHDKLSELQKDPEPPTVEHVLRAIVTAIDDMEGVETTHPSNLYAPPSVMFNREDKTQLALVFPNDLRFVVTIRPWVESDE